MGILDDDKDQHALATAVDPLAKLLEGDPSPLPIGGFAPALPLEPERIPDATPENFVCLRGPCRHYLQMDMMANVGNPKGTFDHIPVEITRYCIRIPGSYIELTDENVFGCNEWHPHTKAEIALRDAARQEYEGDKNV